MQSSLKFYEVCRMGALLNSYEIIRERRLMCGNRKYQPLLSSSGFLELMRIPEAQEVFVHNFPILVPTHHNPTLNVAFKMTFQFQSVLGPSTKHTH